MSWPSAGSSLSERRRRCPDRRRRHRRADAGAQPASGRHLVLACSRRRPRSSRLGVGINILPHGMRELCELGLQDALAACAIETRELAFYSRHGQFIYKEPRGRYAGYDWPQLSIHRADLHKVLLDATRAAAGPRRRAARPSLPEGRTGQRRRHAALRQGRAAARQGRGGLRRHPFGAALAALSRPGPAEILGRQHVARRGALACLPQRRHHGVDRLDDGRQDGDLSGAAGHARDRRLAPDQLGGRDRAARGGAPGLDRARQACRHDAGLRRAHASTGSTSAA